MTTEFVLLLAVIAFTIGTAFFGEKGPFKVYEKSGPRLGARIERHVTTGRGFNFSGGQPLLWKKPSNAPPTGQLK